MHSDLLYMLSDATGADDFYLFPLQIYSMIIILGFTKIFHSLAKMLTSFAADVLYVEKGYHRYSVF